MYNVNSASEVTTIWRYTNVYIIIIIIIIIIKTNDNKRKIVSCTSCSWDVYFEQTVGSVTMSRCFIANYKQADTTLCIC